MGWRGCHQGLLRREAEDKEEDIAQILGPASLVPIAQTTTFVLGDFGQAYENYDHRTGLPTHRSTFWTGFLLARNTGCGH